MRILALLAFTAAVPLAAAERCADQTADEAAAAVRSAFAEWNEAVMRKDLEKTMAIFSPSIHFQFQGSPDFGYARLETIYSQGFARENGPQWQPLVENLIASPQMVTLFNEWKLMPAGGGQPLAEYRGVDVFQRESDCTWRVTASLNYADRSVLAMSPSNHAPGPAEASNGKKQPLVAFREMQARDLDFVFGHR